MAGRNFRQSATRGPLSAVIVSIVLLLAACGSDIPGVMTPATSSAETPQQVLARVKADVAELRGLQFLEPVEAEYLSTQELNGYLFGMMGEEERGELRQLDEFLSILGLIEPDVDLVELYLALLSEGVLGAYDVEDGRLVVRLEGRAIGSEQELTLAHELTHALQQQHFDIESLLEDAADNLDRGLAVSALAEGDATLLELLYLQANSLPLPNVPDTPVYDSAPKIIQELLLFPYTSGLRMLDHTSGDEDWSGINAAYRDPPRSTEHVIHPDKYLEGEAPLHVTLPDAGSTLGEDWTPIYSSVGGEFLIRHHLDSRLGTRDASEAAAGWGGDAFILYGDAGDGRVLFWFFRWDSTEDAEEFFNGYSELAREEGGWIDTAGGDAFRRWNRPGRSLHLHRSADYVALIIAPSEELVAKLAPLISE